ncbi:transformation/transcription domain-associated protein-like protein isoform X2, partial [Tanacetum coccineum]
KMVGEMYSFSLDVNIDVDECVNVPLIVVLTQVLRVVNNVDEANIKLAVKCLSCLNRYILSSLLNHPLRLENVDQQVRTVTALNFCLALRRPLLKLTPELVNFLQEALQIDEADETVWVAKFMNPKVAMSLTKLRTVCLHRTALYNNGIKEEVVLSPAHALSLIAAGEEHRHVGSINFNLLNSRSHARFTLELIVAVGIHSLEMDIAVIIPHVLITIESSPCGEYGDSRDVNLSHLNLIDLAGSESYKAEMTGVR